MRRKYIAVMFLCFILGGYFIFSYFSEVYFFYTRGEIINNITENRNFSRFNESVGAPPRGFSPIQPFSINQLAQLIGGLVFIIAGMSIWYLIREKEMNILKEELTNNFLMPEEKTIIEELKKSGGESTQKELTGRTGFSKSKIHRILKKLENNNMIDSYPYGMTKKIVIKGKKKA